MEAGIILPMDSELDKTTSNAQNCLPDHKWSAEEIYFSIARVEGGKAIKMNAYPKLIKWQRPETGDSNVIQQTSRICTYVPAFDKERGPIL